MAFLTDFKNIWRRGLLHGVHYGDKHRQLDMLYRVHDPWDLNSERERVRFEVTNDIIRREFGAIGSILELGCGEGLQSVYLATVCKRLYGADVSSLAVARARKRCPEATFEVGNIMKLDRIGGQARFSLVTACEMLYYVKDVRGFIERMSRSANFCLVTYYASQRDRLDPEIAVHGDVRSQLIRYDQTTWIASWWTCSATTAQAS